MTKSQHKIMSRKLSHAHRFRFVQLPLAVMACQLLIGQCFLQTVLSLLQSLTQWRQLTGSSCILY